MGSIIITIPPQEKFSTTTYIDKSNCYIAKALRAIGHDNISVGPYGYTRIGNHFYKPVVFFNANILINNFMNNTDTFIAFEMCDRNEYHRN